MYVLHCFDHSSIRNFYLSSYFIVYSKSVLVVFKQIENYHLGII